MKSKIHRATITSADLHYEGSLTVDEDLLDAADLVTYEEVQVVNVNNFTVESAAQGLPQFHRGPTKHLRQFGG